MTEPNETLDRMEAILLLANREAIKQAGEEIRSDKLSAVILDASPDDWSSIGEIRSAVKDKGVDAPRRTLGRRLAELVGDGALYSQGRGAAAKYKPTGLV